MSGPKVAMVLAAGLGTRMRPLTDDRPKALVEVGGKALIDHVLDRLVAGGVETAVVNVHYFADLMESHLSNRRDLRILISDERAQVLETGGGLNKAEHLLGPGPVYVANIDAVWIEHGVPAVAALAQAFDPARMDACLLLAPLTQAMGFDGPGDAFLDGDRLSFRGEAASAPFAYAGLHITRPDIARGQPDGPFSLMKVWRPAAAAGRMGGAVLDGYWMHVGDPQAREEAEARLRAEPSG